MGTPEVAHQPEHRLVLLLAAEAEQQVPQASAVIALAVENLAVFAERGGQLRSADGVAAREEREVRGDRAVARDEVPAGDVGQRPVGSHTDSGGQPLEATVGGEPLEL